MVGSTCLWLIAGYITWIWNGCKAYMPFISDFDLKFLLPFDNMVGFIFSDNVAFNLILFGSIFFLATIEFGSAC